MRGIIFYLFTAATLAAPIPALTQPRADNNQAPGRQVAMEICGSCHRVFEGQAAPVENVPSFIAIANMPSTTALSLRVFLQSSRHMTRMPNFIISKSDTDAVIDYILSLKRR
jgi:mono/diheme cytochrome c family protein